MSAITQHRSSPLSDIVTISRIHIVAIAALGTLTFGWIFTGTRPWALAAVAGVDWFVVNLLNRAVDLNEDRANRIGGTDLVARHRQAVLITGFGMLVGSLALTLVLAPALTPLRVFFHSLGFAYNWRLLPGGRRIKELYFWKNAVSAFAFVLTAFGYPLVMSGLLRGDGRVGALPGIVPATIFCAGVFFFLFELSYEVIYDLRDMAGDARAGVRTYPVVHGERVAVAIIDGLLAASMAILIIAFLVGVAPWRLAIMAAAPLVQLILYKRAQRRGVTSRDCVKITWTGAGLLAAYHVWAVLGLPGVEY